MIEIDLVRDGEVLLENLAQILLLALIRLRILLKALIRSKTLTSPSGRSGRGSGCSGSRREETLLRDFALPEVRRGVLEFLVLEELAHEFPARIFLLGLLLRRLHGPRAAGCGS